MSLPRLLRGVDGSRPLRLDEHVRLHGARVPRARHEIIELTEASGLSGRGGAGFPTALKLRAVSPRRGRAIVVANATEGEPESDKDKLLLRTTPHLVLDGIAEAALAVNASEGIVAIAETATRELLALESALGERGPRSLPIRVATVPDRFIAGQESALVRYLGGGPLKPTMMPPRPSTHGVGGRPTLVQNAETLAHLALLCRHGHGWFRELGTTDEPGSALITLRGAVAHPGVYEIAIGTPLPDVLALAGGATEEIGAVLVGGYFGGWIAAREISGAVLSNAALRPLGCALGARLIHLLPARASGLAASSRITRYLAASSAGQCGPCVHGLAAIADCLELIADGRGAPADLERLARFTRHVRGRGACRHPDGAAAFVESAMRVFQHEIVLPRARAVAR